MGENSTPTLAEQVAAQTGGRVHKLPTYNLDAFKARFAKLTKRAEKLGVPAPTFTVHGVEEIAETGEEGVTTTSRYAVVTVTGEAPKFDGWQPLAVIDLDPEDAPGGPHVVHVIAGDGDPAWRAETDRCDHCTQTPKGRKKLVVVGHDDGTQKVVGTTCVKDFLGHLAPERIAQWFEIIASLDDLASAFDEDGEFGGGRAEVRYDPVQFLAFTVSAIRKDGWVSRGDARVDLTRFATADQVLQILGDLRFGKRAEKEAAAEYTPTDEQIGEADAALEWARDLDAFDNDYLANIQAVASKAGWRYKDAGLGASIAIAYMREIEREVAKAKQAEDLAGSVHVGEVKEKFTFEGDVLSSRLYSGAYGSVDIIRILTTDGNVLVWWASGSGHWFAGDGTGADPGRYAGPGDHVFGKATVKGHGEYQGVQETTITRAKLSLTPLPEPKARKRKVTA